MAQCDKLSLGLTRMRKQLGKMQRCIGCSQSCQRLHRERAPVRISLVVNTVGIGSMPVGRAQDFASKRAASCPMSRPRKAGPKGHSTCAGSGRKKRTQKAESTVSARDHQDAIFDHREGSK